MATTNCKYHPVIPARWTCPECEVHFCSDCITTDSIKNKAHCPLCKKKAEQIRATNFIVPFWNRIPQFFLYPANIASLLFISLLALLITVTSLGGMFGKVTLMFCGFIFLRYAMAVLEKTSNGKLDSVDFSVDLLNHGFVLPIKQILVFFLMYWILKQEIQHFQFRLAEVTLYLFIFLLPAQIMILVKEDSIINSINPLYLFLTIKSILAPYLIMFAFLSLLYFSFTYVQKEMVLMMISGGISLYTILGIIMIATIVTFYTFLIMFNMMGYVAYQYHEELNYEISMHVDEKFESHKRTKEVTHNPELAEVEVFIMEGRVDEAIRELKIKLSRQPENLDFNTLCYNLLKEGGDKQAYLLHAQSYMNVLFKTGKKMRASQIYHEILAANSEFKPLNADLYLGFIEMWRSQMKFKEAVNLGANFHKTHPQHPDLVKIYFLLAQILCENLNNDKSSQQILDYLLAEHKQSELYEQINTYVQVMKKVS